MRARGMDPYRGVGYYAGPYNNPRQTAAGFQQQQQRQQHFAATARPTAPEGFLPDSSMMAVHDYAGCETSFADNHLDELVDDEQETEIDVFVQSAIIPDYRRSTPPRQQRLFSEQVGAAYPDRDDAPNTSQPKLGVDMVDQLQKKKVYRSRYELTGDAFQAELAENAGRQGALDAQLTEGASRRPLGQAPAHLGANRVDLCDDAPPVATSSPVRLTPEKPQRKKKIAKEAAARAAAAAARCRKFFAAVGPSAPKKREDLEVEVMKINRTLDSRVDYDRSGHSREIAERPFFDPHTGVRASMRKTPRTRPQTPRLRRTRSVERTIDTFRSNRSDDGRLNAAGNKLALDFSGVTRKAASIENLAGTSGPNRVAVKPRTAVVTLNGQNLSIGSYPNRVVTFGPSVYEKDVKLFFGVRSMLTPDVTLLPAAPKLVTDYRLFEAVKRKNQIINLFY